MLWVHVIPMLSKIVLRIGQIPLDTETYWALFWLTKYWKS